MSKAILTAAVAGTILVLAGCASPITSGTVLRKSYEAGYSYLYEQPVYTTRCTMEEEGSSDEDVCSQVISTYLPVERYQPPEWKLYVRGPDRTGWVDVDEGEFDRAVTGQKWHL